MKTTVRKTAFVFTKEEAGPRKTETVATRRSDPTLRGPLVPPLRARLECVFRSS
jgi:hypothetical protein